MGAELTGPDSTISLAAAQLARMRGMTGYYHRRFFGDIRFSTTLILGLAALGFWGIEELFLAIPAVALVGACQTAFDASYLIFARQYAASLESFLNRKVGEEVLVAARLEHDYLFPLDDPKIVTLALGSGFSWFGFMTALYTVVGAASFVIGLVLGWGVLTDSGAAWMAGYLIVLLGLTTVALGVGWWWFVAGNGERRLRRILDETFAT